MRKVVAFRYRHGPLVGTVALAMASALVLRGAEANPKGGAVVGGQATISQAPGQTTIRQQSNKAIINWQGFDIDPGETTSFIQPGSRSIALNRVDSKNPSLINGRLEANGNVWVVNPSGVVFGPTAVVDVQGIVATTSDILDSDFMNDRFSFSIPSSDPNATVINQGSITIGEVGLAGLVAPHVRNEGTIVGTLGQVVLAGTPTFTLDFHGDGLIKFAAASEVVAGIDPDRALVENTGAIRADGGHVLLTAAAAAGVVNEVINSSGVIEARSISQDRGTIVLHGGSEGIVAVSGQLNASGIDAGTHGGDVEIRGEKVLLAGGARIDASGQSGGGRVRVGGDSRGGGEGDTAKQVIVAPGATITADAMSFGDGGEVIVWADDQLVYAGAISARGGPHGGDGGNVETSSLDSLTVSGTVDVGAVAGEAGQWLLDPFAISIIDTLSDDPPTDGAAIVSAQSINQATGDVVIEATGIINVLAPFSTQNNVVLKARLVNIEQSIETPGTVTILARIITSADNAVITAERLNIGSFAPEGHPSGGDAVVKTSVGVLAVGRATSVNTPFGVVTIENEGNLVIDGENASGVLAGSLHLTVQGTLTLDRPIITDAVGDAIVLVTNRLINNVGPNALTTPNGRALVYSVNPKNDVTNGIPATIVYQASIDTAPPAILPETGNVIVYQAENPEIPEIVVTEPPKIPEVVVTQPPVIPEVIVTQPPVIPEVVVKGPPEIPEIVVGNPPRIPRFTSTEVNVITDPIVIVDPIVVSSSELAKSDPVALAAPSPTVFSIPSALDSAGSQDLLFSNDGNYELWGLSGPQ